MMPNPSMMEASQKHPGPLFPLMSQIEFYFSPQNLSRDKFLLSQLNATDHLGAVAIEVLCNFPKVRQLHALIRNMGHLPANMTPMADPMMVRMALEHSSVVRVSQDGMWVVLQDFRPTPTSSMTPSNADEPKAVPSTPSSPSSQATGSSSLGIPTHPLPAAASSVASSGGTRERNIVIVRDIPSGVSTEEVLEAFETELASPISARHDVGNTWFVTFETEDQAVAALAASRDRAIRGVPVLGRIKSDTRPQTPLITPAQQLAQANSDGASVGGNSTVSNGGLGMPPLQSSAPSYPVAAHPVYVMTMQQHPPPQSFGAYGYAPYSHYGMPFMVPQKPNSMAARVQQQYFQQGYGSPTYPHFMRPHPSYTANGKPPPNVYVRPKYSRPPQSRSGATNGSRSEFDGGNNSSSQGGKRNKKKRWNSNNNGKKGARSHIPPSFDDSSAAPSCDSKQQEQSFKHMPGRDGLPPTSGRKQRPMDQSPAQISRKKKQTPARNIDLGAENFPALGGGNRTPHPKKEVASTPASGGYAQALLKKVSKTSPSKSETKAISPDQKELVLDEAISKLAFSEDNAPTSYDEW